MSLEELTQALWQASEKARVCRVHLTGEPLGRTVHPYGICQTSANKIVVVVWQSMGFTKAGGKEGYRNLILEEIDDLEVLESHFTIRSDFNPQDGQYRDWVYHL
jgi:hypothetical protein